VPQHLSDLFDRTERFDTLDNELATVHAYMAEQCH
jgi:hypothetical protein